MAGSTSKAGLFQRPFLKWAGNKFQILDKIMAILPEGSRLIEPFVGSGAVFLNGRYNKNVLADANPDIIHLFNHVKNEGQPFIDDCRALFTDETNTPEAYYEMRELFNTTTDPRERALMFVYFNRHGYNGLCRYNSKGGFNVPFGKYKKPYFPQDEMMAFHKRSQHARFVCQDFSTTMLAAKPGDVVYCDPPYVPLSETASFTTYSAGGFGQAEQEKLGELAEELSSRGVTVIISNHDTEFTQHVYRKAKIYPFDVRRSISCKGDKRDKASEVLALFNR